MKLKKSCQLFSFQTFRISFAIGRACTEPPPGVFWAKATTSNSLSLNGVKHTNQAWSKPVFQSSAVPVLPATGGRLLTPVLIATPVPDSTTFFKPLFINWICLGSISIWILEWLEKNFSFFLLNKESLNSLH